MMQYHIDIFLLCNGEGKGKSRIMDLYKPNWFEWLSVLLKPVMFEVLIEA